MSTTIQLSNILQETADLSKAGAIFYDLARSNRTDSKMIVDMTNVTSLPSIFLNVAFGRFIDELGIETVKGMFAFSNITKQQAERLLKYFSSYKA